MQIMKFLNKIITAVLKFFHLERFKELIVYVVIGGLTTVVDWLVFALMDLILPQFGGAFFERFPNAVEYSAAWAAAVIFAYFTNKYLVFEAQGRSFAEFFRFVLSRVFTLVVSLAGDALLCGVLEMNKYLAKLIIAVIVVILNYITSKLLVFTKKKNGAAQESDASRETTAEEKTGTEEKTDE